MVNMKFLNNLEVKNEITQTHGVVPYTAVYCRVCPIKRKGGVPLTCV